MHALVIMQVKDNVYGTQALYMQYQYKFFVQHALSLCGREGMLHICSLVMGGTSNFTFAKKLSGVYACI